MQDNPTTLSTDQPAIEVKNLVKHYEKAKFNAVDDISFSVRKGEIFGLLGPNGAGKTTTIGILTTSVLPTKGIARISGIDVPSDPMAIKERIAIVPQRSNLDQSLRAREILTFHASYHGVPKAEREARADALLAELGLADRAKDIVRRYSGGMAQRLMMARALMHSPEVLFLDEPTNSLDPQSRLFLWDRIRELNAHGVTILLTTHDMDEADQLCNRIAIMDHGKILVLDTAPELKKLIPGGTRLEVRVRKPELVTAGTDHVSSSYQDVMEKLRSIPGVIKLEEGPVGEDEHEQGILNIYTEDAGSLIVPVADSLASSGIEIRDLHVAHPSLEDVFIYLTGRNLR